MSARPRRQGSASFTIVIGGIAVVLVGAMLLTFIVYPFVNAFTAAPFFSGAETTAGARVNTFVEGAFVFTGGIILLALLTWVWIRTRQ